MLRNGFFNPYVGRKIKWITHIEGGLFHVHLWFQDSQLLCHIFSFARK